MLLVLVMVITERLRILPAHYLIEGQGYSLSACSTNYNRILLIIARQAQVTQSQSENWLKTLTSSHDQVSSIDTKVWLFVL